MRRLVRQSVRGLLLGGLLLLVGCASTEAPRQRPSDHRITASDLDLAPDQPFSDYVSKTAAKIRAAAPAGTPEWQQGAELRAPFEEDLATGCDAKPARGKSFLLVHGYTDSPYLMRGLAKALRAAHACAPIRAVALPGHATIPGDLLETDYEEWIEAMRLAVDRAMPETGELWLVAFSTGSLLAADYALTDTRDRVAGLVLISPLIAAQSTPAWLGGPMEFWSLIKRWSTGGIWPLVNNEPAEDRDPVKYESSPVHANAQILQLVGHLGRTRSDGKQLRAPVFAAVSAADSTVRPLAALEFFCSTAPEGVRRLLWYTTDQRQDEQVLAGLDVKDACRRDITIRRPPPDETIPNFSHVSLPVRPEDEVYGRGGSYRSCVHYWYDDRAAYERCRDARSDQVLLGETTDAKPDRLVARLTYNPDFSGLVEAMNRFIAESEKPRR